MSVNARVTVSKKVFLAVAKAVIRCRGRVKIDDALNAHITQLHCEGEGMVGTMVVGLLHNEIKQWEGRQIPLATFSLGSLHLHDVKIRTEAGLRVEAVFGN